VRTGYLQIVPPSLAGHLRANVEMQQRLGIEARVVGPTEVASLVPGARTDDITVGAYEAESGYADPYGTAAGFLAAARSSGARVITGCRVNSILVEGESVVGVETDRGRFASPVVVDVAGAWAAELAGTVGVDIPVEPWRHSTAFFGLPDGRRPDFPIVIDEINQVYFRPEGREMMLVGLESGNELGGSPDRPLDSLGSAQHEELVTQVCARVPWTAQGALRTARMGSHRTSARSWAGPGRTGSSSPADSREPASRPRPRSGPASPSSSSMAGRQPWTSLGIRRTDSPRVGSWSANTPTASSGAEAPHRT